MHSAYMQETTWAARDASIDMILLSAAGVIYPLSPDWTSQLITSILRASTRYTAESAPLRARLCVLIHSFKLQVDQLNQLNSKNGFTAQEVWSHL